MPSPLAQSPRLPLTGTMEPLAFIPLTTLSSAASVWPSFTAWMRNSVIGWSTSMSMA